MAISLYFHFLNRKIHTLCGPPICSVRFIKFYPCFRADVFDKQEIIYDYESLPLRRRTTRTGPGFGSQFAVIGADGYPYITPVNYVRFQGKVYFHCAPAGEKLNNLERDPKVCFEVDIPLSYIDTGFDPENRACRAHQLYHCVIIRGEARVVPDGLLKTAALNALLAAHEPDGQYDPVHEELPAYKACKVVEITPVSISAKSDLAQNRTPTERAVLAHYLTARNLPGDSDTVEAMGIDPDEM